MTQSTAVATITKDSYEVAVMEFLQHGDITRLPIASQLRLYEEKSQEIGMTSMDRPFSIISFKGKMTLYLTAFAANRYASDKNIVRTIVSKPCIEDLNGKPAIYVHIRGTLNGRTEEDHYWREISNDSSIMVQMSKAQSAARRRVTMLFMSPRALQGVISQDDIYQLGLDETKTDESAVTRIVEARATITEEMPEDREQGEAEQEQQTPPPLTLAQAQKRLVELCEQFAIDGKAIKFWRERCGIAANVTGLQQVIKWFDDKDTRAAPSVFTWILKNVPLVTLDTFHTLFQQHIRNDTIVNYVDLWKSLQATPNEWEVRIADLASEAVPQPAA